MSTPSQDVPDSAGARRMLPALLVLFVGSGCSALIYEIVWFQLLRQVIGASAVSLGILLTSFMGGMFLGSLAFPKLVPARWHPLRVYGSLEIGIGASGLVLLAVLPLVRRIYFGVVGYGIAGVGLRAFICLLCLLPPTVLMGATLPAIGRWMRSSRTGMSQVGFLYSANILGAVAGCLSAGFYFLRVYDMVVATMFAAALNTIVAAVSLWLARGAEHAPSRRQDGAAEDPPPDAPGRAAAIAGHGEPPVARNPWVYAVIGLSGFTALGAQVVWTRLLSLLFGATVYTFSIILAVFLIGLGLGSVAGSFLGRHTPRPARALGWTQLLLVAAIPFGAFMISEEIPFWYANPSFYDVIALRYGHDLLRASAAMLAATCLWGASFPLALAAVAGPGEDAGYLVGRVYAANTVGAILGALSFSMFMIPAFGTHQSQQRLTALAAVAALVMFAADRLQANRSLGGWVGIGRSALGGATLVWFASFMVGLTPAVPNGLVAYGHFVEDWDTVETYHYVGEGMNSSVAVSDWPEDNVRSFHVGGKVVASTRRVDMRLQRMLGHLPALFQGDPRSVLIVGFGAGVTSGSFVVYPDIERIVVCEIEPLVPRAAARYFGNENYFVVDDPRTEIIFDDARHFVATTDERFDVITSDPIHPWVNGSAALYSAEYYELVKERLNPGGVVAQWLPLYETSEEAVKSSLATFLEAFPDGTVWNSDIFGDGYDVVMIGKNGPMTVDLAALEESLARQPRIRESLSDVDFYSGLEILSSYVGQARDLRGWLRDAQINRDRSLRLQYLAGLAIDTNKSDEIYRAMARYRTYPDNIFVVPPYVEEQVRMAFGSGGE